MSWLTQRLPRGAHLSPAAFATRHRFIFVVLWLHLPLLTLVGAVNGHSWAEIIILNLPQVIFGQLAWHGRTPQSRAGWTSLGLTSASVMLIHLSDGMIEAHFHIFVVLLFIALYQQWGPLLWVMMIAIPHHAIWGGLAPQHVFGHPTHGTHHLLTLLLIHMSALLAQIVGILIFWHFAEASEAETARAQTELLRSQQRFRALVQHSSDVVAVIGEAGALTYVSPAARHITGYEPESLVGTGWLGLLDAEDRAEAQRLLAELHRQPEREVRTELRVQHADGSWHWHEIVIRNMLDDPSVAGLVANHRNITERRAYQEQLAHEATHDSLTGLPNRVAFFRILERVLASARDTGRFVAVLFIDLDGFKEVNDTLGHDRGDLLLREAARRLQTCVRQADVVARLAGDEFSMVLSGLSAPEDVSFVIERVIDALEQPMQLGDDWANVSASVGVALTSHGDESADELLRRADAAMYQAKRERKTRRTTPVR
jgi:diguanylate cyclase (GGDEF)-like protein/PAS domain S-box-containing protein